MRLKLSVRRRGQAWACLGVAACGGMAWGQSAAWEQLKRGHAEEVARGARPLREGYRKALLVLEGQLAGRGDYAGAQRVQVERRQVEEWLGEEWLKEHGGEAEGGAKAGAKAGEVKDGEVVLGLSGASEGGLRVDGEGWIGWEVAGAGVRWALPSGWRGGGYGVELRFSSAGAGRLGLAIREDFHTLLRQLEVPGPGAGVEEGKEEGKESRVRLGTLRMRPGATFLEVKVMEPGAAGVDFRLMSVHLIPEGGEP